jgi:hypothetical protein
MKHFRIIFMLLILVLTWCAVKGCGQNKDNLCPLCTFEIEKSRVLNREFSFVKFQGYWIPDDTKKESKAGAGIVSQSLFICRKETMSCFEIEVTYLSKLITLIGDPDTVPVKVWNKHRIVIQSDPGPEVPCPVLSSTVVDFDTRMIRGSESAIEARWHLKDCKELGLTPEIANASETLASVGGPIFSAW